MHFTSNICFCFIEGGSWLVVNEKFITLCTAGQEKIEIICRQAWLRGGYSDGVGELAH